MNELRCFIRKHINNFVCGLIAFIVSIITCFFAPNSIGIYNRYRTPWWYLFVEIFVMGLIVWTPPVIAFALAKLSGIWFAITRSRLIRTQPEDKSTYTASLLARLLPDELLGDIREEREERIQTSGLHAANRWYAVQVLASLCWQLGRVVARMVSKIAK